MSSLGLSLLILALLGVGGVVIYNLWLGGSFRRVPRRANIADGEPRMRGEPRLAGAEAGPGIASEAASPPVPNDADSALVLDEIVDASALSPAAEEPVLSVQDRLLEAQGARPPHPPARLDPVSDCCVTIRLDAPMGADRLIALTRGFRRAGGKPVLIEGRSDWPSADEPVAAPTAASAEGADGDAAPAEADPAAVAADVGAEAPASADGGWEPLVSGRVYGALRVGILLANRHGPLNAMEYSEFVNGLQSVADSVGAFVDPPDMMGVLELARDLDARCAALDAQIGVNVEAPEALSPADLVALAQSADIVERGNNRYARLGGQGEVVFSVALGDSPNRLTFLLDVPRVEASRQPLRDMVSCAWHCAQAMQGRMVDDTGRALTEAVFQRIEAQLDARYAALAQAGFAAGSPVALRLFN